MKIRNKILVYFSVTVMSLTLIFFALIYYLFSEYREEEFQQEQLSKIKNTISLIEEYKKKSAELSQLLDEQYINDFYDEKLLVYDHDKSLIFSSIDQLEIYRSDQILHELSPNVRWIEKVSDQYDVVGVYLEVHGKSYYAISKAYDNLGHSKRVFLGRLLVGMFALFSLVVWGLSLHLSKLIAQPIVRLSKNMMKVEDFAKVEVDSTTLEIQDLAKSFNALLDRTKESFAFQKHSIHHISHELKTPIAVLVSELDALTQVKDIEEIRSKIPKLRDNAKNLGEIIHVLLEISKIDSGQPLLKESFRIDELYFDVVDELRHIYPAAVMEWNYPEREFQEEDLLINGNRLMFRQVLQNLLLNGIAYSSASKVRAKLGPNKELFFENEGPTLSSEEQTQLFSPFFRGENSRSRPGFGLGLALTQRILNLHGASISYFIPKEGINTFHIQWT
ncbi:integral membrane sensor signal transduction histidine kinase [Leadbetterella byssophila DSM 17132]|uniref:histidine kinase n=1 Tax=Leadbetterella byssophila (strain DSM 17132 / JCM 16389 / KACC 11308 / NBRC 106382 / 4M15) TaxID=649349 RepID=E4RTQ8_LEAB4|nr:HAMP domain-containing sensor histidine kinase [Leadbetterella byssophila]ADQ17782.1 integral membrane sensor signal transduction histidine kinase [Leadbetterella byssophila DSM 17132]